VPNRRAGRGDHRVFVCTVVERDAMASMTVPAYAFLCVSMRFYPVSSRAW
jgi:hypothetical protein